MEMKSVQVVLKTVADVQTFVTVLTGLDGQFDFVVGDYILDAKSLMGVLALERSMPLQLNMHQESRQIKEALAPFIVKA